MDGVPVVEAQFYEDREATGDPESTYSGCQRRGQSQCLECYPKISVPLVIGMSTPASEHAAANVRKQAALSSSLPIDE